MRNLVQLHFLGEFSADNIEIHQYLLADLNDGILWRHGAVGSHSQLEFRNQRMSDNVAGKRDVLFRSQPRRQQVSQGVVLFVEREDGRVWNAWQD